MSPTALSGSTVKVKDGSNTFKQIALFIGLKRALSVKDFELREE